MYNPYLIGKHVYLRHPTEADVVGRWHEWFSDPAILGGYIPYRRPNCVEKQREFYNDVVLNDNTRMVFSIVDKKTDKHIGVCNLSSIDWVSRYCDFAFIVGEKEFRCGVYTLEVAFLLMELVFKRLNFRWLYCGHIAVNIRSHTVMKFLGFEESGRHPQKFWCNGSWADHVFLMLSQEQWASRWGGTGEYASGGCDTARAAPEFVGG